MRFIHISDLHFNPNREGRTSRKIRAGLISYLQELNAYADELLITGDFRHARYQGSDQNEIDEVVQYIKNIAKAVGITDVKHIHLVPGNHDRDRKKGEAKIMAGIRKKYNPAEGFFEEKDLDFLLQKFEYFFKICNTLYGSVNFWDDATLHTYRIIGEMVFLYLNTAIMHYCDTDRKESRLIIGNDCLDRLLEKISNKHPDYPIIVLAHHSPDYFEKHEKEAVEDILRSYPKVFLYLCGDAHETWIRKVNGHVEITMGCLKLANGVEESFLYGNTETQEYFVHHWAKGWEPFMSANAQLKGYFPPVPKAIAAEVVVAEQDRIKNDALLPWLRNSPSIRALFPRLFVHPNLKSEKKRIEYNTLKDLINCNMHSNIVLTGEAGAGKTTLLRQLFLFENPSQVFLYIHAKTLVEPICKLKPYQIFVRSLLLNNFECDKSYIVLLDGIDEVYSSNEKDLAKLINSIDKLNNTKVWFGWRKDHFSRNETEILRQLTSEVVSLGPWTKAMANDYVKEYAKALEKNDLFEIFQDLTLSNQTIEGFSESPFQLALLVYLLDNKATDSVIDDFFTNSNQTIFALYDVFFKCWIKKERTRGTSYLNDKEIREVLWSISNRLYYHNNCEIKSYDSAIKDLLTFSVLDDGQTANGFFHRSFCAFFLADKAFHAVKAGDICLIETLITPMRNDVTDFLRSAICGCNTREIEIIQTNLINAYEQIDSPDKSILSKSAQLRLKEMDKSLHYVLKNEIIYLVSRITDPKGRVPRFLEEKNEIETDPYLLLDIAYAATLTGPKHIALEYAKTLEPGSKNEFINRSWTIAYFGDVQDNPHDYRDQHKVPWTKSREVRMRRFQDLSFKSLRFRIFDFPLLYCFYSDREWKDVNETDYNIIEQAVIENEVFTEEEKRFLRCKKEEILLKFKEQLSHQID